MDIGSLDKTNLHQDDDAMDYRDAQEIRVRPPTLNAAFGAARLVTYDVCVWAVGSVVVAP
jgi:hypothetical protein